MSRIDSNGGKRRGTMLQRYFGADWSIWFTSIAVGLAAGGGAIVFRWLIGLVHQISFTWLPARTEGWGSAYIIIAPAVGGYWSGPSSISSHAKPRATVYPR